MKKRSLQVLFILLFVTAVTVPAQAQKSADAFSFIISSDQREHATPAFRTHEFTLGGYEAIKKVGKGSFMVVLGDLDPPTATRELIASVLGKDYLWYPVVGNHDTEVEANTEYLRSMNRGPNGLPYILRKGPAGCEETTYSFDWNNVHFVVLNVYFDGKSDRGGDGNIVPELLAWLENDLKQNKKPRVFVIGHEPIFPFLDIDNGTIRHLADALDKYPDNSLKFQRLLVKYGVTAYFSGHTHCASYANVNGLWLINSGHLYGQEGTFTASTLFPRLAEEVTKQRSNGMSLADAIKAFYKANVNEMKKFVYYLGFGNGKSYKDLTDEQTLTRLSEYYDECSKGTAGIEKYSKLFWTNTEWRKSTFLRLNVTKNSAVLEMYRDKGFGGDYALRLTQKLY
ncbi:MAG: metallophosphoesterase [Ignavibacteriales bacterium]|nr:metallophosphoesterase [Ignavibacteriales bacterium]